jgi:hypothetical protein
MTKATLELIKVALRQDTTISSRDRRKLLVLLERGADEPATVAAPTPPRVFRRAEAARMLGRSVRTVDTLVRDGILVKVRFPGRKTCAGITSESLLKIATAN